METNLTPPAIDTALLRALSAVTADDASLLQDAEQAEAELSLVVESALFDQDAQQLTALDDGERILSADAWGNVGMGDVSLSPRASTLKSSAADANLQQMVEQHSDSISAELKVAS
jgi:hypothetical protein